jgi:hypothetical protein
LSFKNKKRKGINAKSSQNKNDEEKALNVTELPTSKMEISFNGLKARFNRLMFKGCPNSKICKITKAVLIDKSWVLLSRDDFVREMYEIFQEYSKQSETGYGRFCFLCKYVGYWDIKNHQVTFDEEEVLAFFKFRESLVTQGKINKNSLVKERQHLTSILKEQGKAVIAAQIPKIENRRQASNPTKAIADKPYVMLGKRLMQAYQVYVKCLFEGKPPIKCPFFDPELALENGMTQENITKSRGLNYVENKIYWTNTLTKLALLIAAKWTGANLTPLASLTKGDTREIKKSAGDTYKFDSVKARALYERQELGIGFTKRSKEFIESWLIVSDKIVSGENTPLFPLLDINGRIKVKKSTYNNPHKIFNPKLKAMGLPEITCRKLRSTRSSIVQRAFEDIFVTAAANRNTPETTHAHYLEGVDESHEIELARAFEVQKALAEGKNKKTAIEEFKQKIKDPFTSEEWLEKRKNATGNKTLNGARCTEPKGDVAKKSLRAIKSLNLGDDGECISFLACFDCSKHALVAEVDDIWLMFSFKDALLETISRPSINSIPNQEFKNALDKTNYILSRMKAIAPEKYNVALNNNKEAPHPLYQDDTDLSDLLEIYAL